MPPSNVRFSPTGGFHRALNGLSTGMMFGGVVLMMLATPAAGHGTCYGGKYTCTCVQSCKTSDCGGPICSALNAVLPDYREAGRAAFNYTMLTAPFNASMDTLYGLFVQYLELSTQTVTQYHLPDGCDISANSAASLRPIDLDNMLLIFSLASSLYLIGMLVAKVSESLFDTSSPRVSGAGIFADAGSRELIVTKTANQAPTSS